MSALPPDNLTLEVARSLGQRASLKGYSADEVISCSMLNGVAELLSHRSHPSGPVEVEDELRRGLAQIAQSSAANDLLLNHATQKTLELLQDHSLPTLLLKGTALAWLVYPAPYIRRRCDTDLLIREEDVDAVAQLLLENGYRISGYRERQRSSRQFGAGLSLMNNTNCQFDIHWRLSNRQMFRQALIFDECWKTRQSVEDLGPTAQALSNTHLLFHACMHRIAHGRGTERNRLIWLYDIHLLWQAMDEETREGVVEKALDKQIGAVCADAIQVCCERFMDGPTEDEFEWIKRLQANQFSEPSAHLVDGSRWQWVLADLKAEPGLPNKMRFCRELLISRWKAR